jgi:hypothetical protein
MKKGVSVLASILLVVAVVAPAFAATERPAVPLKGTQGPDIRKVEPKGTEGPDIRKVEPKGKEGPDIK